MKKPQREHALKPRTIMVSFRANEDEVALIESALKPGESRSEFLAHAAMKSAISALKKINTNPKV